MRAPSPPRDDTERLPETPPVEIPNHVLVRCLGVGGFGQVWLGRHRLTDHYRACKLIHMSRARELDGLRRIKRDVPAHPGLVPIEEVGLDGEWLHCLMPLADSARFGQAILEPAQYRPMTLRLHLTRHGRMSTADALIVARQLADAIEHLHRHGVMHGDIKPANVLRLNGRWALADYGLADDIDAAEGVGGTPGYVPPEGPGSPKADQFAFGVLVGAVLGDDAVSPTATALRRLAERATAARPEDRFASMSEVNAALAAVDRMPPPVGQPVGPPAGPTGNPRSSALPGAAMVRGVRDAIVDFWVAVRHGGEAPEAWRRVRPATDDMSSAPPIDADAIACADCGYALRSLPPEGRCPECALPVAESLRAAGLWTTRRLKFLIVACACLIAMLPMWLAVAIIPLAVPTAPTALARTTVAGCMVVYAVLLTIAAIMSVHAASRHARRTRYALIGGIGAIALLPLIRVAWQMISPTMVSEAMGLLLLFTLLATRVALLMVVIVGMRAAARALATRGEIAWVITGVLTLLSVLPWVFIVFVPAVRQTPTAQTEAAGIMMLGEAVVHAIMLAFVGILIAHARRRLRAMRP